MYYLCNCLLPRGHVVQAYLNDKDAVVGKLVKVKIQGKMVRCQVDGINQTIEDQYVLDNKLEKVAI